MRIIAKLLQLAAPLKAGFSFTIHNPPWQDLVIRDTQERGPHRLPAISVAQCSYHDGCRLRTPEMIFEVEESRRGIILTPYCLRDEKSGVEQYSVRRENHRINISWRLQGEHAHFARQWNASLEHQGFVAAFQRAIFVEQLRQEFDTELVAGAEAVPVEVRELFERAIARTMAKNLITCQ